MNKRLCRGRLEEALDRGGEVSVVFGVRAYRSGSDILHPSPPCRIAIPRGMRHSRRAAHCEKDAAQSLEGNGCMVACSVNAL